MTLDQYRSVADRLLGPWVSAADRLGLSPDQVSVIAFLVAVGAAAAFALGSAPLYATGALLVLLNGWLDVVDGALARHQGVASDGGDFLDHVLDRYADVAIIAGLTAGVEAYALGFAAVTGVLLTSYLGTQIQAVGIGREYGGLLGRADRLALAGIVGVVAAVYSAPIVAGLNVVGLLLALFAAVGHLTAVQRFLGAWRDL
ncbi:MULTISPECIES: CDP-alcohol phosphatidyltransferase family protein [Halorubrum]|jgi:archaetidylinositol phosphate synthase|uniref:CDP-diacylglycerol--glycerol-3-phosphate 3-phosphatidyltransferase n=1 Tax=Halorubrum tropicale TaxID=1765655 RepID=A0A0M9AQW1_9EURY|nr:MULTISPECIES: CDP-alcohol phosphatidyltransferase family protein [Halorubrum]KOX97027.1 CDP-diacylglycerol--glycerol-3-phosphate 3-phosphatidyltransferase [Halorubrum tropicale]RLM51560.1 CDP-alcohol phosphatidyltransferase family protein [Halorubrum sp. Atlit-28R]TKX46157.1 CDP-alcohol phosphatidyltransferase family protein [Halorubrum sp. ARQ200]TKX49265.1 CDP-alcohol phosphatidyltransferase family protein [Halorubrum sp. ASP121]TKX59134.1 CDP-alcohol phosphatidyltransferase family protei